MAREIPYEDGVSGAASAVLASPLVIGAGTKQDGLIIRDAAEVQTTNNTQTTLDSITLLDENTYHVEALVNCVKSDGLGRGSYHISVTVYRTGAGVATLVGGITAFHMQDSNASLNVTFTVSGSVVRVSVTGIAAETWEWSCILQYINMSN